MKLAIVVLSLVAVAYSATLPEDQKYLKQAAMIKELGLERATVPIVEDYGYPIEEHYTTTADGYILKIHHIPYGRESGPADDKPAVFVQHGLLSSSADWVVTGPGRGLALVLADAGFDVWMGNARGNTHSRNHNFLSPDTKAFWDFGWHEIGQFDLPAMIDYVIAQTGQPKIHYIGHSQGTTSFFVMGSERPEYNDKIRTMHALAPIAFMSNLVSPFVRAMSPFVDEVEWIMNMLGVYEFMPSTDMMEKGGYFLCRDESIFQEVCANVLFLIGGFNSAQLDRSQLPAILASAPAGASVNQLVHYGQGVNSGKFRMYDYGTVDNLLKYGSITPPDYQLSRVTAPVFLHYSDNDWLAAVKDVDELAGKLGNLVGKFRVTDDKFTHLDFCWAIDAQSILYDRVISLMNRY